MSSAQNLQTLLRFLSQDAKLPLAQALGKVKDLQAANLNTPSDLASAKIENLKSVFEDDKTAKTVLNAAKRVSKKRKANESGQEPVQSPKKAKPSYGQPLNPAELEASLALPDSERNEDVVRSAVIFTNRAPLVLAFAVTLLKYTMPDQPVSSRLSLAQAVTSMNSKSKAVSIGIDSGQAAEDEGWGEGQPLVRIMTRDIRVMKRWGYEWEASSTTDEDSTQETLASSANTIKDEAVVKEPALWGVDLEALKKQSTPNATVSYKSSSSQLPIYTAQSARAYILRAFETPKHESTPTQSKKPAAAAIVAEKKLNLGLVLGALELLFESWTRVLSKEELDKRAWSWYVRVRPEVASGAAGWGGKGNVKLSDILDLRRPATPLKHEPE